MNTDDISTAYEKDILLKSKRILFKLINKYSYESVIEYLFNPRECQNKKIEKYINYILNKIGVDNFANLLCNEELKFYYNIFNEELERNNKISNLTVKEKEEAKIELKDITANENENNMLNEEKTSNNMSYIDFSQNKVKKPIVKDIESFIEEYTDEKIEINSFHDYNSITNKSNITYINSESNTISEMSDSNINKVDIISITEEINEKYNIKEEEEELYNEIDSVINSIIYKEPIKENINYYCFESNIEDNKIKMKCADEHCKSKGIYNITNKEIKILVNHSILYEKHYYYEIFFEREVSNLNLIDFIKDSPTYKGLEIKKIRKIKKNKEGEIINEKNEKKEKKKDENEKKDIEKNEEVDKNQYEEKKEDIVKDIFQYKTENNIKQIIDVENNEESKEINNQDILISFDFNVIKQNNINNLKSKTQNDEINKKSWNKKENKSINFEEKNNIEIKENNFNYILFKIEDLQFNNNKQNNFTQKMEYKKQDRNENKRIYINNNFDDRNGNNTKIVIDGVKNDDCNSILSVISNLGSNNEKKEKIIENNIDEKDYDFFYSLYGNMQMKKVDNLLLFTDDFEKKKNLAKIKKKYHEKTMKEFLKRKKEKKAPNINNSKEEKEVKKYIEQKGKKDNKDIIKITKCKNKRKIFEVVYNTPSSMINLIEEEENNKNINKKQNKRIIQENKIKKIKPIFSVYNPSKNTPKFIVNNYVKVNNTNDIEKNVNTKEDNNIFNNDINKNNINISNKPNNIYSNNKPNQNKQIHINKKSSKIKNKIKRIYNDDKKCNIKNKNTYNPNEVNNNENKDNNNINIDDEKDVADDNKKYKILIKKTVSNKKEDYLIGYDSTQNKSEIIFEINNKILYLNEYIIVRNKKIGFHFHKNEFGNVFNYFPTPFQTLQDIIQYKCCLRDCESRAEYNLKTKKFVIIKEHSKSYESHYFSNYNNYIFKKITEFMKNNSNVKDLQFILN